MATQEERFGRLEQKVDGMKDDVAEMKETLKTLVTELDKRYAPKWVGDVVKGLVVLCLVLVFTVVISNNFSHKSSSQTVTTTIQNPDGTTTKTEKVVPSNGTTVNTLPTQQPGQTTTSTTTTDTGSKPSLLDTIKEKLHI